MIKKKKKKEECNPLQSIVFEEGTQFHFTFVQNVFIDQSFSIFFLKHRETVIFAIFWPKGNISKCVRCFPWEVSLSVYMCVYGGERGGGLQKSY